jgi:hypothetical protein
LEQQDLLNAIRVTVPLSRTMREDIDQLKQWARTRARPASVAEGAAGISDRLGFTHGG